MPWAYTVRAFMAYLAEVVDDHGNEASLNDSLHLLLVARGDVGEEPHCLLSHKHTHNHMTRPPPRQPASQCYNTTLSVK